jgi:hypothetical protein
MDSLGTPNPSVHQAPHADLPRRQERDLNGWLYRLGRSRIRAPRCSLVVVDAPMSAHARFRTCFSDAGSSRAKRDVMTLDFRVLCVSKSNALRAKFAINT